MSSETIRHGHVYTSEGERPPIKFESEARQAVSNMINTQQSFFRQKGIKNRAIV
jgi:hypothetical protein